MVVAMKINRLSPETLTEAKNARQVFLMVAELHKLGYEGLRITPFLSPSGCYWRCCIVPARMTQPRPRRTPCRRRGLRIVAQIFQCRRGQLFRVAEHESENPGDFGNAVHPGIPDICRTRPPPRSGLRRLGAAARPDFDRILRRWRGRATAAGVEKYGKKEG